MSSSPTAVADLDAEFESNYAFEDLASKLARQLSMILVGIIILSSIRVVLRGVTRVCFLFPRSPLFFSNAGYIRL